VAKLGATALALVQAYLPDLSTFLKKISNGFVCDVSWKATNKNSATIIWANGFRDHLALSMPICRDWLVLCKVHAEWYSFDQCARELCCFVHCFSVKKLDVAKVAIAQLIDLQADHFYLTA